MRISVIYCLYLCSKSDTDFNLVLFVGTRTMEIESLYPCPLHENSDLEVTFFFSVAFPGLRKSRFSCALICFICSMQFSMRSAERKRGHSISEDVKAAYIQVTENLYKSNLWENNELKGKKRAQHCSPLVFIS